MTDPLRTGAYLKAERVAQLRGLSDQAIGRIVEEIRRARTIPRLQYHFEQHGRALGAGTPIEYLARFREHLRRGDLRLFTYLRGKDRVAMWEMVAPGSGATVMYNENRRSIWSFFLPRRAELRMTYAETAWIEVVRGPSGGWAFEEAWRWKR